MRKIKVNEIFYSLQGEGCHTGHPAVFVRLSGCNLSCAFCDTQHTAGTMMTMEEIVSEVNKYPAPLIILTGGEPSLFIDEAFIDALHTTGKKVAIETNGTHSLPSNIDWVTCSPKDLFDNNGAIALQKADEVKVIYDGTHGVEQYLSLITATHYYLQPCDTGDAEQNSRITRQCIQYCLNHPQWHLSLQTHKILNIQ